MLQLTKEQTYTIIFRSKNRNNFELKYKFKTFTEEFCLNCLEPIFLTYKQFALEHIFCPKCKYKAQNPNIVHYHYMRIIKERQINFIENHLNNTI